MTERATSLHDEWFLNPQNFGGLPQRELDSSQIVVLPVPYETSTTYRAGCRLGPSAIIEASANMELYDEELSCEPHLLGISTLKPLEPADDPAEMLKRIEQTAMALLEKNKCIAALGGEHTVTLGLVRALTRKFKNMSVLFIDAHADFRDSYHGNKLNHACVARRISELCPITQVGIRSLSKEEAETLEQQNLQPVWAHDVRALRGQDGVHALESRILRGLSQNVYISIDADGLDPSIMPGVGTPEPGGLLWDEILNILKMVCKARTIIGLDFVELAPIPGLVHPEFLAARLLYKVFAYIFRDKL